jgi:hypothetical protein
MEIREFNSAAAMIMALRQFRVMQEVRGDLLIGDKL